MNLIVAIDSKGGISKNGMIPWKYQYDINFFVDVTKRNNTGSNVLIMGRNTFQSLPTIGLEQRIVIIVSSTLTKIPETKNEIHITKTFDEAIQLAKQYDGEIYICGGRQIYVEALKRKLIRIYITRINEDYNCDNFFPVINKFPPLIFERVIDRLTFQIYSDYMYRITDEIGYLDLMYDTISRGHYRKTRNANTWSQFGRRLEFDLGKGFPLLTTKKMFLKGVFEELMFFIRGQTDAKYLSDRGVKIWEANTSRQFLDSVGLNEYEVGDMGTLYSFNLTHYGAKYQGMNANYEGEGINQFEACLNLIKKDPYSRRILLTAFNPANVCEGPLYPCHTIIGQWYVTGDNRLDYCVYNRSQDLFLGTPFNICSSALLMHFFCHILNNDPEFQIKFESICPTIPVSNHPLDSEPIISLQETSSSARRAPVAPALPTHPKDEKIRRILPGRLIMDLGDVHVYEDHLEQAMRQILREPYPFPQLNIKRSATRLTEFQFDDIEIVDYRCMPPIKASMIA